jgi:peptide/nickel transport system ATP-binding protein
VSLNLPRGATLGIVGESGSGKSTLARCIVRLIDPDIGSIMLNGRDWAKMTREKVRRETRHIQMVFQDPFGSLNPRRKAAELVAQGPIVHGTPRAQAIADARELFALVGLDPSSADRYPHEFSGGQRQRIGLARALALKPDVLVADEPVSALDLLVQAQILNLLATIREERNLAIVLITHDLTVVEHIADRVAVMYLGRIVEEGPVAAVTREPAHPYTRALLASAPRLRSAGPKAPPLRGELPSPLDPPPGCHFNPRCPLVVERCLRESPVLAPVGSGQVAACHVTAPVVQAKEPE